MSIHALPTWGEAIVMPGVGEPLHLVQRTVLEPEPGFALIHIEACGVCGSDLFLHKGGFGIEKLPVVPGHEAAGRVMSVGSPADEWLVGKQVALYYINAPQGTSWVEDGHENIGPGIERMGVDVDGAFAEFIIRPIHTLIPVEPEMDPAVVAVATDALATPYHALVDIAQVQKNQTVVVIGLGGIGSNAVQIGKLLGARVIAVGRSQRKLEQALELGADVAISSSEGTERVREVAGTNIDVVVECSGVANMARFAISCAGFRSRVVLVGASMESFSLAPTELIWRESSIMGSRGFTRENICDVLEHIREGRLVTSHLTNNQMPLRDAAIAFEDLKAGLSMRTILVPRKRVLQ